MCQVVIRLVSTRYKEYGTDFRESPGKTYWKLEVLGDVLFVLMIKQIPVSPGQRRRAHEQSLLTKLMSQEIRNLLRKFSGMWKRYEMNGS